MSFRSIFAALYDLVTAPMEWWRLRSARRRSFGGLSGTVLDLGAGTGPSLPHFSSADRVVAVDPDLARLRRAGRRRQAAPTHLVAAEGERLPFRADTFDAAATALVLCTIPDLGRALAELDRVLVRGGRLAFIEHVRLEGRPGRLQDILAPAWKVIAEGCHLNRRTVDRLRQAGWEVEARSSLGGLMVLGRAVPGLGVPGASGHNDIT